MEGAEGEKMIPFLGLDVWVRMAPEEHSPMRLRERGMRTRVRGACVAQKCKEPWPALGETSDSRMRAPFDWKSIKQEHAYYLKYQNLRFVRTPPEKFAHAHT